MSARASSRTSACIESACARDCRYPGGSWAPQQPAMATQPLFAAAAHPQFAALMAQMAAVAAASQPQPCREAMEADPQSASIQSSVAGFVLLPLVARIRRLTSPQLCCERACRLPSAGGPGKSAPGVAHSSYTYVHVNLSFSLSIYVCIYIYIYIYTSLSLLYLSL